MKKRRINNRKKVSILITLITFLIIGMTLGSSLLSSTLNITGKSTIKKSSWVIYFDNIVLEQNSVHNTNPSDDATISVNGTADPSKQNIEFLRDSIGDIASSTKAKDIEFILDEDDTSVVIAESKKVETTPVSTPKMLVKAPASNTANNTK